MENRVKERKKKLPRRLFKFSYYILPPGFYNVYSQCNRVHNYNPPHDWYPRMLLQNEGKKELDFLFTPKPFVIFNLNWNDRLGCHFQYMVGAWTWTKQWWWWNLQHNGFGRLEKSISLSRDILGKIKVQGLNVLCQIQQNILSVLHFVYMTKR